MNENFIAKLPKKFRRNTLDLCGEAGKSWLDDLPQIIKELESVWHLKAANPFENLSYNYVAPCVCDNGDETVLKIALPLDNPEIYNEASYLEIADGNGAVKLLSIDENRRALLLERLTPGENLKLICRQNPARAVEVAISVLRRLLKEARHNSAFRLLADWFDSFFEKAPKTDFPSAQLTKTRKFYEQLNEFSKHKSLLHGDLHHENILSATRERFLAIDPKGIVGDVGYEIAVFLNNHLWWLSSEADIREQLNRAIFRFSEAFEIEPDDLRKWAYAQMVLSVWWTFEENGENWQIDLAFTEFWDV